MVWCSLNYFLLVHQLLWQCSLKKMYTYNGIDGILSPIDDVWHIYLVIM